jgi:predicted helicase
VTNARCLTEGIDVPSLDAVAFVDPRSSAVDIVQAVGRVMRTALGKDRGYVVVPVFLQEADLANPEAAVESSAFARVLGGCVGNRHPEGSESHGRRVEGMVDGCTAR